MNARTKTLVCSTSDDEPFGIIRCYCVGDENPIEAQFALLRRVIINETDPMFALDLLYFVGRSIHISDIIGNLIGVRLKNNDGI